MLPLSVTLFSNTNLIQQRRKSCHQIKLGKSQQFSQVLDGMYRASHQTIEEYEVMAQINSSQWEWGVVVRISGTQIRILAVVRM